MGAPLIPWALDDVALGVACPQHCSGQGDCVKGVCQCDEGFYGQWREVLQEWHGSIVERDELIGIFLKFV